MRIRTIKPEFWASESVGRLSRDARLLFIGFWSLADDSGRGRGALPTISGSLFPYDPDALKHLPKWISELEREGMVRIYKAADGNTYFDIPKWLNHQKIEKPSAPKFPPFTEQSGSNRGVVGEGSPLDQGSGNREQGVDQGTGSGAPGGEIVRAGKFVPPTEAEVLLQCAKIGLPDTEARKFLGYYEANGWRVGRNPMKSWPAALTNWKGNWEERRHANHNHRSTASGPAGTPIAIDAALAARLADIANGGDEWPEAEGATQPDPVG